MKQPKLTILQARIDGIELVENGVPDNIAKVFFIDGPGGSGKTYLYEYLILWVKSHFPDHGQPFARILPSATTGIAAVLSGGQTLQKTFCIPIPCLKDAHTLS